MSIQRNKHALLTLLLLGIGAVFVLTIGFSDQSMALAQVSAPSPTVVIVTPTIDPAVNALNQAQLALTQAQGALLQANTVSSSASQAVSQAGIVLNFIQVVAILGSVLAALAGLLFAVNGLRTLNDYQADLAKSREDLNTIRAELEATTAKASVTSQALEEENARQVQALRAQAVNAYRSLGLLQMGEQQFDLGNHNAALQMYQEAYQLNPDNEVTNYFLGELYLIERDLPEAVKYLERAIQLGENMSPAYAALGLARRLQSDGDKQATNEQRNRIYAEAEQLLLKAVELNPGVRDINKESAYNTLGGLYRRQGRLDEALINYIKASHITPNSTYPLGNVAQLYFLRGDFENARKYYQMVLDVAVPKLSLTPHDIWLRLDIITAQLAVGQQGDAAREVDILIHQEPSIGQLETGLSGFHMLQKATPPLAGVAETIARFEQAIKDLPPKSEPSI